MVFLLLLALRYIGVFRKHSLLFWVLLILSILF